MQRNCLKCGHVNNQATGEALEECPQCGAIYTRVEASAAARATTAQPTNQVRHRKRQPLSPLLVVVVAVGTLVLLLIAAHIGTQRAPAPAVVDAPTQLPAHAPKPAPMTRTPKADPVQPPAAAEATPQEPEIDPDDAKRLCSSASQLAKSIMTARQNGVPMAQAMEFPDATDNEKARAVAHAMVITAYEKPRFTTQEFITRAVADFESEMYLYCIKAM